MVGQPETEPTPVRPSSYGDPGHACPEDLQRPWHSLHKMSSETVTPPDALKSLAPLSFTALENDLDNDTGSQDSSHVRVLDLCHRGLVCVQQGQ